MNVVKGPLKKTVDRFWRMVRENKLQTIVMLTKCSEAGKVSLAIAFRTWSFYCVLITDQVCPVLAREAT